MNIPKTFALSIALVLVLAIVGMFANSTAQVRTEPIRPIAPIEIPPTIEIPQIPQIPQAPVLTLPPPTVLEPREVHPHVECERKCLDKECKKTILQCP